jgi:orotate phosphoribosyltransferase
MLEKQNLIRMVKEQALEYGDFTLKSGAKSKFYLDCRKLVLMPDSLYTIIKMIGEELSGVYFDAIGGPAIGADPIVGGFLYYGSQEGLYSDIRGFLVRPEPKDHGKSDLLIGNLKKNDRVVLLEDVTTTGGSILRVVDLIEPMGCQVVKVISIIDRLQGAKQTFAERGIPFSPLCDLLDLDL